MRLQVRSSMRGPILAVLLILTGALQAVFALPNTAPQSHFFLTRDGVRLHYIEAGAGPHTIIFVPGWTMPGWIFDRQMAYFSQNYHVIALDPRGQGQSQIAHDGYDQNRRGADIGDLIAHVGGGPPVLVGWSLGVLDVLAYVHQAQGRGLAGLVLIDNSVGENPPPVMRPKPPRSMLKLHKPAPPLPAAVLWGAHMRRFVRGMFAHPPGQAYLNRLTQAALRTPPWAARRLLAYPVPRSFWRDALYTAPIPILYVVRPRWAGQAANVAAHPNAQSVVFTGVGHALFVDQPDRFNSTMQNFLSSKIWP